MAAIDQDAADWERARALFLSLVELDPAERERELARLGENEAPLRGWVERLLAQDLGPEDAVREGAVLRLGAYETQGLIAAGGMGEVFRARRVDGEFDRLVAAKLLKPGVGGEELVRRFLRERQTLAQLDHEFIARLLDGGTTEEGRPYLVMEYVEGRPIDDFCREEESDLDARLELFQKVCEAVQHAHERGIVHRDLKPSNVLVRADATPRLLDFGIARIDDEARRGDEPLTRTGHRMFTPEYAAPEQVRGTGASPATDVFALGVMLYELLAGARPWGTASGLFELERAILEHDPLPPSRLGAKTTRRRLSRDLDTVVLKCLSKNPSERYPSVAELSKDLERYRAGYPIRARRTSGAGRVWRYARRKPLRAVALLAVVTASLAAFFAMRSSAASEQRRIELVGSAETMLGTSRQLRDAGDLNGARAKLDEVLGILDEFPDETGLRADALVQLGLVANHEERFGEAVELLESAAALMPDEVAGTERLHASLLNALAFALRNNGEHERAAATGERALAVCREHLAPGHGLTVDALSELASIAQRTDPDLAQVRREEATLEARGTGDEHSLDLARALNNEGLGLANLGRHSEAVERLNESIEIFRWHRGDRHPAVAQARANLGMSYYRLRRLDDAHAEFERALNARIAHFGERHEKVAEMMHYLALVAVDRGRNDVAYGLLIDALDMRLEQLPPTDRDVVINRHLLGHVLFREGRREEALEHVEAVARAVDEGTDIPARAEGLSRYQLGAILEDLGLEEAARAELERALEIQEAAFGHHDGDTAATLLLLRSVSN